MRRKSLRGSIEAAADSKAALVDLYRTSALVGAAYRVGLFGCRQASGTIDEYSAELGCSAEVMTLMLESLELLGLAERGEQTWLVSREDEDLHLAAKLAEVDIKIATVFGPEQTDSFSSPVGCDVLARAIGPANPTSRAEIARELLSVPYLGKALQEAARYLELGGGRGVMICSLLEALPQLSATVVDRSDRALGQLASLASMVGVASRLEVIQTDLPLGFPNGRWNVIYWSQAFFKPSKRATILARARRELLPNGLLFMFPYANLEYVTSEDRGREHRFDHAAFASANQRLLSQRELVVEAEGAGFRLLHVQRVWEDEMILVFGG